ncbi:MAG: hypothetical protein JWO72_3150 [Caulobacteraceae bacterium]|nr:hypothetical protein [Caulobacteraceae bacterium]
MALIKSQPLIPANAGTQIVKPSANRPGADQRRMARSVIWIPAFAGTSGEG